MFKWEDFSSTWGITREDIEKGGKIVILNKLKGKIDKKEKK